MTQPGKSGTYAEKLLLADSITTAYRIGGSLFRGSLFEDTSERPGCQVAEGLAGNRDLAFLRRMFELSMGSTTSYLALIIPGTPLLADID